jgi:hypothetical protein
MASWSELNGAREVRLAEIPASGNGRRSRHSSEASTDTREGEAVLARAVGAYEAALGPRLIAAYALGSLAHGGFSQLVSDVDLGLVLQDPPRATDRLAILKVARPLRAGGSALDDRLSVFWGTPSTLRGHGRGGRFPPLDRLDLIDHGRLVTGHDARAGVSRPDQAELLVAGSEFALGYLGGARRLPDRLRDRARLRPQRDGVLDEIRTPSILVSRGPRRLTKVVLFPVRFLFTAKTGQVGSNNCAAEDYVADRHAPAVTLVTAALSWRFEPPADDAATALLGRELIPLYTHYIDDHITRLRAINHHRLADDFDRWRTRLLA